MSLILEALKKSEAQRRLGEMPDLGTPITATRRQRHPLPWLAFAAVLAIAAVGAWRYLRPVAPPPAAVPAGEPAKSRSASAAEPTMRVTPPAMPAQRATPKPTAPAPAAPAPAAASTGPAPPPTAAHVSTPAPPAARTETAAAAPATAPTLPAATPASAPAVAAAAPPPPVPAPAQDDVPTVDELPPDVRAALPALPITMQVYSPDPKRRFVIIDGTRVVEGESVRGVTVQEIRQAGLVLEFHGHRALLRPGS